MRALADDECWARLRGETLGRLAFENGRFPMILPVNHTCHDGLIVVRTDGGTKLENVPMHPVAFEVDGVTASAGWSVVALGSAREVTTALGPRYEGLRQADVPIMAPGRKPYWIAIEVAEISGREFDIEPRRP